MTSISPSTLEYAPTESSPSAKLRSGQEDRIATRYVLTAATAEAPSRILGQTRAAVNDLVADLMATLGARPFEEDAENWRLEARRQLRHAAKTADTDDVQDEEFSFLAAYSEPDLGRFLAAADRYLGDTSRDERAWHAFLRESERQAISGLRVASTPPSETFHGAAPEHEPLFTLESLGVTYHRGAIGGPPPLVDENV